MNQTINATLVGDLRALYETNDAAHNLLDKFSTFKKDVRMTPAGRASNLANTSYRDIIKVFKELDRIGAGEFKAGRRGAQSRMEWRFSVQSLGQAANGTVREPKGINEDDLEDTNADVGEDASWNEPDWIDWIDHTFQLRPDLQITFRLPADLNSKEAERLAGFIRSVPFGE